MALVFSVEFGVYNFKASGAACGQQRLSLPAGPAGDNNHSSLSFDSSLSAIQPGGLEAAVCPSPRHNFLDAMMNVSSLYSCRL